jgi:L-alanine-DL-glutamate epimerase-like enolase superfamily enzyme
MGIFDDRLADLPLKIDDYGLTRLEADVSSGFHRVSTLIELTGAGATGIGEDVTYDEPDHDRLQAAGAIQPLAGEWTMKSFCDHLETLDLWPAPAEREASVNYRVWAYESAALDLALLQAGKSLHEVLGRAAEPLTFVVSIRLGEPSTIEPLKKRLDAYPSLRFKLDPTNDWTDELVAEIAATGAVDSVDFKGHYSGSVVDVEPDPALYKRVLEAFPDAWLEDPHEVLYDIVEPYADRVTWDAPIHSVADIKDRPWKPRMVNIKPSRLGGLRSLLAAYEYCKANDIRMYGGGQFELGRGRDQIQYLGSLFHPTGPNDVAPTGFNLDDPPAGLPTSPIALSPASSGFRLA